MKNPQSQEPAREKIPCSVVLITLNAEAGLQACLESLKDFEEIIVADGNSTDRTRDIAKAYGARVVKQYDTDEEAVPCVMDKAAVRERAFARATLPWRFFMDGDDTLSPEAVEEMRQITTAEKPAHLVWRMPSRIVIAGRLVEHEAAYPAYQVRLVHRDVAAHFKGAVHERLVWDEEHFPVGTMQSFYFFHWSAARVAHYRKYLDQYVARELATMSFRSFAHYLDFGIYRRARTIIGYLLWRIPGMYLRWGREGTMPLWVELEIVRYHFKLLFGSMGVYAHSTTWWPLMVETLGGKDINRALGNLALRDIVPYGRVIDLGGDRAASYWRFMREGPWRRVTIANQSEKVQPDVRLDLEQPFPADMPPADTMLLFNVLEHIRDREGLLSRIHTALRPGGALVGVVPFLVRVHPDPHDYARYTKEQLIRSLSDAGFNAIEVQPIGKGPFIAGYSQYEFAFPRFFKLIMLPIGFFLDGLVERLVRTPIPMRQQFPLSYRFTAKK